MQLDLKKMEDLQERAVENRELSPKTVRRIEFATGIHNVSKAITILNDQELATLRLCNGDVIQKTFENAIERFSKVADASKFQQEGYNTREVKDFEEVKVLVEEIKAESAAYNFEFTPHGQEMFLKAAEIDQTQNRNVLNSSFMANFGRESIEAVNKAKTQLQLWSIFNNLFEIMIMKCPNGIAFMPTRAVTLNQV